MRKLKEGSENANSCDTRIYPVVRLATKAHLHPHWWNTHKEYCFSAIKSLLRTLSPRSPWSRVPLRSFSTKEGGLHVPCTKFVIAAPHQTEGSKTCRRVTKTPRMAGSPRSSYWLTQEPATRYNTLLLHSLMSYPSTLTYKDVLNLKDLITLFLGWLGDVLGCV